MQKKLDIDALKIIIYRSYALLGVVRYVGFFAESVSRRDKEPLFYTRAA